MSAGNDGLEESPNSIPCGAASMLRICVSASGLRADPEEGGKLKPGVAKFANLDGGTGREGYNSVDLLAPGEDIPVIFPVALHKALGLRVGKCKFFPILGCRSLLLWDVVEEARLRLLILDGKSNKCAQC